jgi:beta-phosphoglucomutase
LLRALILDFDGVLVDSEPIVLRLTQQMAAQEGWSVSPEEYYRDYLALDDRGIVERLYQGHGRPVDPGRRNELVAWKAREYEAIIREGLPPFPGAVEFIRRAAAFYPLAIASGSLRAEIEHLLGKLGLRDAFKFIVSAEDTERSKPDPEIYRKALKKMQSLAEFHPLKLRASECLAIEDAPGGILAARGAGLNCLALSHSRPAKELMKADWVFRSFEEIDLAKISSELS